eukprot:scaffold4501_cov395-Prasinococcus_capsulatus_cf.AAC.6
MGHFVPRAGSSRSATARHRFRGRANDGIGLDRQVAPHPPRARSLGYCSAAAEVAAWASWAPWASWARYGGSCSHDSTASQSCEMSVAHVQGGSMGGGHAQ